MTWPKMILAASAALFCLGLTQAQDRSAPVAPRVLPVSSTDSPTDSGNLSPISETPAPPSVLPTTLPPTNPFADGGMGAFGGIRGGSGGPGYSATWYPSRSVSGQSTDLALFRQNLSLAAPLWKDNGDALMLTGGIQESHFTTSAVLPDTRRAFPSDLWNINLGLNYLHHFDNGWTGGLMTSFGSSSDKPFNTLDVMNVSLGGFLRVPTHNDRDAWNFAVIYNPVGNLNFPIPLVSYTWNPSEQFQMNIGLPLSLTWRPTEDWTVNLSYMLLTNIRARVTYRVIEGLHVYAGYEYGTESYFLAERADTRDRFFGFEQRLVSGVRWDVWRHASIDVNGGYAFNRYYGEGLNQGTSIHDRVDVAPGAFLGLSFRARF